MRHEKQGRVSRRAFIQTSVAGTTALLVAPHTSAAGAGGIRVRGACPHDCPDTCAWIVTTESGRAIALEGDADHPYTRGTLCEKMDGFLADVVYNPERVLHPLKRIGAKGGGSSMHDTWVEVEGHA